MHARCAPHRRSRLAGRARCRWADDEEHDAAEEGEANEQLLLTLCVMELLSKGRLLYHLFDDDHEARISSAHTLIACGLHANEARAHLTLSPWLLRRDSIALTLTPRP